MKGYVVDNKWIYHMEMLNKTYQSQQQARDECSDCEQNVRADFRNAILVCHLLMHILQKISEK